MNLKHIFILSLMTAMLFPAHAWAHKVIIFAWVEDGMVHSESSFGSKRKAKDCAVTVFDETGKVVHQGRTDQAGNYSFKLPEKIDSDLILKLDAGTGHKGQWRIPQKELQTDPTANDIKAAMKQKETLEKDPSVLTVLSGIAIIFLVAFSVKYLKRKS